MPDFPKIYSLSTVGIRQHNNYDYLFHEVRTDFTGKNGTGKSIIADLIQLIFIPFSNLWKSGTEGLNKQERTVWGMPLPKNYVQYAYTFLNIEKAKGKYITIGVFIPKNKQGVRPFIIQKGSDFENKKLVPFDFPLKAVDFLADTKAILSLDELKRKFAIHDLFFKDFYQKEDINEYFDILYKTNLCPIDLTREGNLKTYAKILQSFSRAKSLDINNSRSLQNFLFEDEEEIKKTFEEQKEQLESLIKQYRRDQAQIEDLNQKQKRLSALEKLNTKYQEDKKEHLIAEAINAFKKYSEAKEIFENNQDRLIKATENHQKYIQESKDINSQLLTYLIKLKQVCNLLREKYEALQPNYSPEIIESKRKKSRALILLLDKIEKIKDIYKRYNSSINAIETKYNEQKLIIEQKGMLNKLAGISTFSDFEASKWTSNFDDAKNFYQQKAIELNKDIENLQSLFELYDSENPNSLFQWAINQKKPLSLAQETVLMNFRTIATKKSDNKTIQRYTLNPQSLINSFEETITGVWLILGDLREFIPFVSKQKFNNVERLKTVLENDKTDIKEQLTNLQDELNSIKTLDNDLNRLGYNPEFLEIWQNRKYVEEYLVDKNLTESIVLQIKEVLDNIDNYDRLKAENKQIEEEITQITTQKTEVEIKLRGLTKELRDVNAQIVDLQKDIEIIIDAIHVDKTLSVEDLEKMKENLNNDILTEIAKKSTNQININTQNGIINSCKDNQPIYKQTFESTEKQFNEKRINLEKETDLKFESLLQMGDFSDVRVLILKDKHDNSKEEYQKEFTSIAQSFKETKDSKNPELETNYFNFETLVRVLCGRFRLEDLTPELTRLNEELTKFGDLQLQIIYNVFGKVEKNYHTLRSMVVHLNNFFKENKISNIYTFRVDFNDKKDISIDWIGKMRESAKVKAYGKDLFTVLEENEMLSPEQLIIKIAQQFNKVKNCELSDLLNPKYYFELKVGMFDDNNISNSGSGGQAYTALALLCIGRLSIIQRQEQRPGVKFIIIEELSNIDDTNFNTFPEIAKQFGYQLLTMTPKPFGSYTDDDWFLHMLSKGTDKDINYLPMSFFKTRNSKQILTEYLNRNELENFTGVS